MPVTDGNTDLLYVISNNNNTHLIQNLAMPTFVARKIDTSYCHTLLKQMTSVKPAL